MSGDRTLRAPPAPREELQHELIAFVAEAALRMRVALQRAESLKVEPSIVQDLRQLAERLEALHLVVMVECDWCPRCGSALTDPARSPSRAHHCSRCRVGWQLVNRDGRITAEALPWPDAQGEIGSR